MMMDGFDLIGSSAINGRLIFQKDNFRVSFNPMDGCVVVNVTEIDKLFRTTSTNFNRLEKAIAHVNSKIKEF